ncbi:MAG: 4Fe-4S binding protein [bacterium]
MNPIYRYFRDIYLGVWTTLLGMKVTGAHLFKRAVTVQYPHQKLTYPPRARTMLVNNIDICNGCLQCARACPVNIIAVEIVKAAKDEDLGMMPDGKPRRLHVVRFDVDMSKCVFCGLCVEACPTDAIHWEQPHEEVCYQRTKMMRRWSKYSDEERQKLLERDAAEKAAKAAAAAATPQVTHAKPAPASAKPEPSESAPAVEKKAEPQPKTEDDKEGA